MSHAHVPFYLQQYGRPSTILGQNFGFEFNPEDFWGGEFCGPRHQLTRSSSQQTTKDPNKFQICIDVHQFAPNEIVVKTIGRQIVVQGKHEEKEDEHGTIYRHFVRKYTVPEGHEPNEVFSSLSSDGVLTITAPREPIVLPDKNERIVPILQTGPVHHEIRELSVEHLPESKKKVHRHKNNDNSVILAIKYL